MLMPFGVMADESKISIYIDNEEIKSDVPAQIVGGRTMVPVRGVLEGIGAEVSYDEKTKAVNISHGETKIKLIAGFEAAIVNGKASILDVAPQIISGRTLVPLRFISEAVGCKVSYDEKSKRVDVKTAGGQKVEIPSIPIINVTASEHDGNKPEGAIDGNYDTRWSADDDVWIEFEIEKLQKVGYIGVAWYCGNERQAIFELLSSKDGKTWEKHFEGMQENLTLNMTAFDLKNTEAKYIKLVGHGNSQNEWNSITEFKVYPPREDGALVVEDAGFEVAEATAVPENIREALLKFDNLVGEDVLQWLIDLYDPETGAFHYTKSGADTEGFLANAEATEFAMEILRGGGLIEGAYLPDWWADKLGEFIQNNQSEEDGYFYHKQWGKTTGSRRDRDYNYSVILLRYCRKDPLYMLANDRLAASAGDENAEALATAPEYLKSEAAFIKWLDEKNWETDGIWSTGNTISSARSQIVAAGFGETLEKYLIAKQDPDTGMWGSKGDRDWMNLNGAMKLAGTFSKNCPYPNVDKLLDSVLYVASNVPLPSTAAITWVWNPIEALSRAMASQPEIDAELQNRLYENGEKIIDFTYNNCLKYKAPDGGFANQPGKGATTIQGNAAVGLGGNEGDMDGTVITSQRVRSTLYSLFGLKADKTYYVKYRDWFYNELQNKAPIVKNKIESNFDFENEEIGALPTGWGCSGNIASVSEDPNNPKFNKVLKISKTQSDITHSVNLPITSPVEYKTAVFECKLLIEEILGTNDFMYNTFGSMGIASGAAQWCIRNSKSLGHRGDSNTSVLTLGTPLNLNEWYSFKIEYTPKTITDSVVRYYVDGDLILETNVIYHGQTANSLETPFTKINGLDFRTFRNGMGTIYLDNVSVSFID